VRRPKPVNIAFTVVLGASSLTGACGADDQASQIPVALPTPLASGTCPDPLAVQQLFSEHSPFEQRLSAESEKCVYVWLEDIGNTDGTLHTGFEISMTKERGKPTVSPGSEVPQTPFSDDEELWQWITFDRATELERPGTIVVRSREPRIITIYESASPGLTDWCHIRTYQASGAAPTESEILDVLLDLDAMWCS